MKIEITKKKCLAKVSMIYEMKHIYNANFSKKLYLKNQKCFQ